MSRFMDRIRAARRDDAHSGPDWDPRNRGFRVLTVTNNKGGVGKTTLAANLAVTIRALREDLPILLIGLDDQPTLDRIFAFRQQGAGSHLVAAIRDGSFRHVLREGQYGVHYVPSCLDAGDAKELVRGPYELRALLQETRWQGLVILDTKSDFEILTRNALTAADLTLAVVKDRASLLQAGRIFDQLAEWGRPAAAARVVLSMVDRRIKYRGADRADVLGLLIAEIRERGYPLLESFISYSPKVASLETNPTGRALPVVVGAPHSLIQRQLQHVAQDVLKLLDQTGMSSG